MNHDNIVTFTHKDETRHIQAANMVGREPDSRVPGTSTWRFDGDEAGDMESQQAEARLRGDNPEITRERRATEVSSGELPGPETRTGRLSATGPNPNNGPQSLAEGTKLNPHPH